MLLKVIRSRPILLLSLARSFMTAVLDTLSGVNGLLVPSEVILCAEAQLTGATRHVANEGLIMTQLVFTEKLV